MGKKKVDGMPNGQYPKGVKGKEYTEDRPWMLTRNDGKVEAERYYKSEGSSFSGWVVRSTSDPFSYSDPIPNKKEAVHQLLQWGK